MYSLESKWQIEILPLLAPKKTSIRSEVFSPAIRRIISEVETGYTNLPDAISNQIEKGSLRLANKCYRRRPDFPGIIELIQTWYAYPARQIRLAEDNLRNCNSPLTDTAKQLIKEARESETKKATGFRAVEAVIEDLEINLADSWNKNFILKTAICGMKRYQFLYAQIFPFLEGSLPLPQLKLKFSGSNYFLL